MKKYVYLIACVVCAIIVSSCSNDDNTIVIDEVWKAKNEAKIDEIKTDPSFRKIEAGSKNGSIYVKTITEGTGERILMTDRVEVVYQGKLIDGTVFDQTAGMDTPELDDDRTAVFDIMKDGNFALVEGWVVALEHMKVGDRWEIWIPWNMGYGITGRGSIPGCSALHFILEVKAVVGRGQ